MPSLPRVDATGKETAEHGLAPPRARDALRASPAGRPRRRAGTRHLVPARLAHRPLQLPLHLLLARGGRACRGPPLARRSWRGSSGSSPRLGVRRIRLTGGEPTLRRDVVEIVADAAATPGVEDVALTTNGHRLAGARGAARRGRARLAQRLARHPRPGAARWASPGPGRGSTGSSPGIEAAAGRFRSLKLNTVVMRGVNEDELADLVRYAWARGALPRFIEQMPFSGGEVVPLAEVRRRLEAHGLRAAPGPVPRLGAGAAPAGAGRPAGARGSSASSAR